MKQRDRELIDQVKEWFSLDKYRPATEFGPAEWAEQISKRAIINDALTVQDETLWDSFKPFLEDAIPKLMEDPLSHFGFGYKNRPNAVDVPTYSTPTVRPFSFKDIDRLTLLKYEHEPEEEIFKAIGRLILLMAEHQSEENESLDSDEDADLLMSMKDKSQRGEDEIVDAWSIKNPDLGLSAFGHVIVDLNARDEDIITDFKRWLTNFRKETNKAPPKPHPKAADGRFAHWLPLELFPYFDLIAWGLHHQVQLKQEILIELIYPGQDVDPSRFRKLKDKIPEVITHKNAMALSISAT